LILLACTAYATEDRKSDPTSPDNIVRQLRQLRTEATAVSEACGGAAQVQPLYDQMNALYGQLPAHHRDSSPLDQGGDDCNTATIIPSVPYCDFGDTHEYTDTYTPPAACGPSSSPDVVYLFIPSTTALYTISLCGSSFNTILHIYQGCPDQGLPPICCNDDAPGCGLQSCCDNIQLTAGTAYYIVVDGAGTSWGAYVLHVNFAGQGCPSSPCPPCVVTCPPGGIQENESCPASSPDTINGGHCGSFYASTLTCNSTVCGRAAYDNNGWDQDNWIVTISQPESLRWCLVAEFPVQLLLYQYVSMG
jgi:hypothetical protein